MDAFPGDPYIVAEAQQANQDHGGRLCIICKCMIRANYKVTKTSNEQFNKKIFFNG
jgi:hypothetical protein